MKKLITFVFVIAAFISFAGPHGPGGGPQPGGFGGGPRLAMHHPGHSHHHGSFWGAGGWNF